MKKVRKRKAEAKAGRSAKPNAIVLAALELFTRYGYRKTSIDDIAQAAQVAKRTVYQHFENKAAVFLAILEYLGDQVRQRCAADECMGWHGSVSIDRYALPAKAATFRSVRRLSSWLWPPSQVPASVLSKKLAMRSRSASELSS